MDMYKNYLHQLFLLAITINSPPLAQFAHYLGSEVLYRHENDVFRFLYIQDTLENCPMPGIKAFAVQWTKREVLAANPDPPAAQQEEDEPPLFSKPIPLSALAGCLFPDLSHMYPAGSVASTQHGGENALHGIRTNYGFYAASANFLYFLLLRRLLHQRLELKTLVEDSDVARNFVEPLLRGVVAFKAELDQIEEDSTALSVLEMVLRDVVKQLKALGWFNEKAN
jgi:hypothetical protein